MENYYSAMIGSVLHSFRNRLQFIELEFANDRYEEITICIDCKLSSSNEEINSIVNRLIEYDKDVAEIAYFIPANNMKISSIKQESNFLIMTFEHEYSVYFKLEEDYGEPLSIAFKKDKLDSSTHNFITINSTY